MKLLRSLVKAFGLVLLIPAALSFVTPTNTATRQHLPTTTPRLYEGRRWNFNDGQGPWGLKKNAEIWNGRVAQVRALLASECEYMFNPERELLVGWNVSRGMKLELIMFCFC